MVRLKVEIGIEVDESSYLDEYAEDGVAKLIHNIWQAATPFDPSSNQHTYMVLPYEIKTVRVWVLPEQ